LIAVVPILIAYIFLQRWIVGGLTAGATKGLRMIKLDRFLGDWSLQR
jgi:hypothetical protein